MKHLKQLIILAVFACLLSSSPLLSLVGAQSVSVPTKFQALYSSLQGSLDNFNVYLNAQGSVNGYPTVFATELLPANGNRGTDLLTPQALQGSILTLESLSGTGHTRCDHSDRLPTLHLQFSKLLGLCFILQAGCSSREGPGNES